MAGYNGLGISKKLVTQDSTEKIYEVKPEDLLFGYEFHLREDILNHTILVKSSVTNNYMSVFMPITMGNDGDFIKFKLYDDLENVNGDTPYVDFWGEDWNEDIDTRYLGTANVDSTDGYYWIAENNNEAYFLKKDGKWTIVRDKGLFDIGEWKNPKFGELNLRNIIADSYLSIKVNDTYVANFNWDKLTIDTSIRLRGHIESLTHITQQDHPSIGIPDYPFGDLHLVGNAFASDPTLENHLATKKYVDENGGIAKLEDDTAPKLSAILDCNYKKLINVQNPSSTYDGVNKAYVDPFKIYSNSTNLNGVSTHTIVAGEFNTILVVENTIASSLDITIQPAVGNFVDIFNDTEFDLTIMSSNGINIRSLNDNVKIPKYGKATLKSSGGYYMLYGDLKA